jgi:hypothetical protein
LVTLAVMVSNERPPKKRNPAPQDREKH